jgi:hypothetical protein
MTDTEQKEETASLVPSSPESAIIKWPSDIDSILENIRCNCIILSEYHKAKYFFLQSRLKYFRIPVIILSAFASVFNIGLQPFLEQGYISIVCCMMSLVTGLIGSIELFLQIQKRMESDLLYSRDFYLLAIDIFKMLSLKISHRNGTGANFLDEKFNIYRKMVENSNIIDRKILDQLAPIDAKIVQQSSFSPLSLTSSSVEKPTMFWMKWFNNPQDSDDMSINTEDRFNIYCEVLKRQEELDPTVIEKLSNIIVGSQNEYIIPMQDRMKLLLYFNDHANVFDDPKILKKLKPILVSDFFHKNKESTFQLMKSVIDKQESFDKVTIDKIKTVASQNMKKNKQTFSEWFQLPKRNKSISSLGSSDEDTEAKRENVFIEGNLNNV